LEIEESDPDVRETKAETDARIESASEFYDGEKDNDTTDDAKEP
jgi:hypothetical protein